MQLNTVISVSSVMIDFSCVMIQRTAAVQLWLGLWVVMPCMVKKRQNYLLVESAGSREFTGNNGVRFICFRKDLTK